MKAFILLLIVIGIIMIVTGYLENNSKCPPPTVEYRFIPRSFYEEQLSTPNLKNFYSEMFNKPSTWDNYPFNANYSDPMGYYNQNIANFVRTTKDLNKMISYDSRPYPTGPNLF